MEGEEEDDVEGSCFGGEQAARWSDDCGDLKVFVDRDGRNYPGGKLSQ